MGRRREGDGWGRRRKAAGSGPWSAGARRVRDASDHRDGRDDVTIAPMRVQDLRRRLSVKATAEKDWRFGGGTSTWPRQRMGRQGATA